MSWVSGVVLVCDDLVDGNGYSEPLPVLNRWLDENYGKGMPCAHLADVAGHVGGNKHPQCLVLAGGFNYFPEDEFAAFVLSLPWERPECVTLVVRPEDGPNRVWSPA